MRARCGRRREAGFTLIEVTMVLVIVGIMLAFVLPRVDSMSPKYALRAAARELGATIDSARASAVTTGMTTGILYDLANNRYQLFGSGNGDDEAYGRGPGPRGLWPAGGSQTLPGNVRFLSIVRADTPAAQQSGQLAVFFDPLSLDGSHIIVLGNENGQIFSVKYNALLSIADYSEGVVATFDTGGGM